MVTVIYKSPQDLALSDCTFITLSFIHTASARQACLLFLELSYLRGLCCTHFCPTSAWNALFSTFAPLLSSFSRSLVTGYFLKEALQGYPYEIGPVLEHSLPPRPASFCFMTLKM